MAVGPVPGVYASNPIEDMISRAVERAISDQQDDLERMVGRAIVGNREAIAGAVGDAVAGATGDLEVRIREAAAAEMDRAMDRFGKEARTIITEETAEFESRITKLVDERVAAEKAAIGGAVQPVLRAGTIGAVAGATVMGALALFAKTAPLGARVSWLIAGTSFGAAAGMGVGLLRGRD